MAIGLLKSEQGTTEQLAENARTMAAAVQTAGNWCCGQRGVSDPRTSETYCASCGYVLAPPLVVAEGAPAEIGSMMLRIAFAPASAAERRRSAHLGVVDEIERQRSLAEDPRTEREVSIALASLTRRVPAAFRGAGRVGVLACAMLSADGARKTLSMRKAAGSKGTLRGQKVRVQVGACAYRVIETVSGADRRELAKARVLTRIAARVGASRLEIARLASELRRELP